MPARPDPPAFIGLPEGSRLRAAHCHENVDRVPRDPSTSAFKAAARLHQSTWREAHGHPMGTEPIAGGPKARPLGSRLPLAYARESYANFVDPRVARAVEHRMAHRQSQ